MASSVTLTEIMTQSAPPTNNGSMSMEKMRASNVHDDEEEPTLEPACCAGVAVGNTSVTLKNATTLQKVGAEVIATFILIFSGAGAGMTNALVHDRMTLWGVAGANGLVVMMMIYATGHISGAHMNPAVTIAFATLRHFPWSQVPAYIGAQLTAAISAGFVLRHVLGDVNNVSATIPSGSPLQSFAMEIIISFILMFVVSAVSTDTRAIGELAGLAVGGTVALTSVIAGPISGASMNPARSLGPAIAANNFKHIWIYFVSPVLGTLAGGWCYNLVRLVEVGAEDKLATRKSFKRNDSFV